MHTIEQTLHHILAILRHQSRVLAFIADHVAAGNADAATMGALTEKLTEASAALKASVDAAQPPA